MLNKISDSDSDSEHHFKHLHISPDSCNDQFRSLSKNIF